jgi:hypothetical protein
MLPTATVITGTPYHAQLFPIMMGSHKHFFPLDWPETTILHGLVCLPYTKLGLRWSLARLASNLDPPDLSHPGS